MALVRVLLVLTLLLFATHSGAAPTTTLPSRGKLTVGPDGLEATIGAGIRVEIAPGSTVWVEPNTEAQLRPVGKKSRCHVLRLERGRVEVHVPVGPELNDSVLVRAPRKVSSISKGGHLVVTAEPGRVSVATLSGSALLAVGTEWEQLGTGMACTVSAQDRRGLTRRLLPAPEMRLETPLLLKFGEATASGRATLGQVPGAKRYEVAILRGPTERGIIRRLHSEGTAFDLTELAPGEYTLVGRAIDAYGMDGIPSNAVRLLVVGVELPRGARRRGGIVEIAPSQSVRLMNREALEMSYEGVETFVPAPDRIGLYRGRPVTVRLRHSSSGQEHVLRLTPRVLRAAIQLSPRGATWPADDIDVVIRLRDGDGRPSATAQKVTAELTVNAQPRRVRWSRTASTLRARVPPEKNGGPWVIRVAVRDELGNEIGRDFLEVARTPPAAPAGSPRSP